MNFLVCVDEKYVKPLAVMLFSLKKHYKADDINIFFPYYQSDYQNIDNTIKYLNGFAPCFKITPVLIPDDKKVACYGRFSHVIWLKIISLFYIPNDIEKVVYIDSDIIIDSNRIQDFVNDNCFDLCFVGINDLFDGNNNEVVKNRLTLKTNRYICSGILLINPKKVIDIIENVDNLIYIINNFEYELIFPEQDFINCFFNNYIRAWDDRRYNFYTKYYKFEKGIVVYHFAGKIKPWDDYDFTGVCLFLKYWKYAIKIYGYLYFLRICFRAFVHKMKTIFRKH